ncbi:CRISPR system Cascade subunit CasC [Raineyella antarctica]|uniref:CRISPR system Cascade subunit CasC n=1 Tax=Raineyella antarctica TaxID=1577474 RepID=A0A1G6H6A2_9ACTN|nr:type I-E CRISPR-associated protein Cas7/Cse4/CasC [Raineyella antarctica]SDB89683.1 CRISPR system Cascade subunit CasC [Raineyella antarctica]
MNTAIDIHVLQTVPPSNINRDDTGSPKTALFGGVRRGRVSSQAWKRATREAFAETLDKSELGIRTRDVVQALVERIHVIDPTLDDRAESLAVEILSGLKIKTAAPKARKGEEAKLPQTGYLIFLSAMQLDALAGLAVEAAASEDPAAAIKAGRPHELADRDHSVDIALFGRMVADAPDLRVDAACQVAHALGVHAVTPEFDYFTAVDDLQGEDESGAGMIGTVEFYSTTFYRYATINVDLLRSNLGDDAATRRSVEAFITAFLTSMPSGKQNTFANGTAPDVALVTVRSGQPLNFVGAFEEPVVSDGGFVQPAVERLAGYAAELHQAWKQPESVFVAGRAGILGSLAGLGDTVAFGDLGARVAGAATAGAVRG